MVNGNTYVSTLSDDVQQDIRKELFDFYFINHDEMNIHEVSQHITNGMGSRLNDLQGLIDIKPYIEGTTLNKTLKHVIAYLQDNDRNGLYIDLIEEYDNGEIEVSTIKEICIRVLTDWKDEGTEPDDKEQLKELQGLIDLVKEIEN